MQNQNNTNQLSLTENEVCTIFDETNDSDKKLKKIFEIITFCFKNENPELITDNPEWKDENKIKMKVLQEFCQKIKSNLKNQNIEINFNDLILTKLED